MCVCNYFVIYNDQASYYCFSTHIIINTYIDIIAILYTLPETCLQGILFKILLNNSKQLVHKFCSLEHMFPH